MVKYVHDRFITGVLLLSLLAAASATMLVTGCPGASNFGGIGNVNGNVKEPDTGHPQNCVEVVNSVPVFLSSDRSILIRDDVDAGHAQLTVTTGEAASSFKWCVQRENPAKAANALLQFDLPLDNDGCVTTATGSQSGGLSGLVNITKVIGDPGPGNAEHDGERVIITVVATVDDVDANNEPIHCAVPGDAPITLQVRRPDAPLLVTPLQTSAPAGANEVAPRGKITLTAKISGGKPFVPPGLNCPGGNTDTTPVALVPDNNGDPYCVQWTVNETQLSPPPRVALAARAQDGDVKAGSLAPQADGSVTAELTYVAPPPVGTGNVEATIVVSDAKGASFAQTLTIRISTQSLSVAVDPGQSDIQPGGSTYLDAKVAGGTPPYDACWYAASVAGEPGSLALPTGRKDCSANLDLLQGFSLKDQKELKTFLSLDSATPAEDKPSFCVCNLSSGVELSSLYTAPAQGSLVHLEVRAIDSVSARAPSALVNLNVSAGAGAQCGDGVRQGDEECDGGDPQHPGPRDTALCNRDCTLAENGDGVVNAAFGEECDDGNTIDTDGCRNNGKLAKCGDAVVQVGVEQCDDGNTDNTDDCLDTCKTAFCGDGKVRSHPRNAADKELCDEAFETATCNINCTPWVCGDHIVNLHAGEQCDDGPAGSLTCTTTCKLRSCGNHVTEPPEQCDDARIDDTHSCLSTCRTATCGDGFRCTAADCTSGPLGGPEACDDGVANGRGEGFCLDDCSGYQECGDSHLQDPPHDGTEVCDDSNVDNTDDCLVGCVLARCGDGFVHITHSPSGTVGATPPGPLEGCDGGTGCKPNCTCDAATGYEPTTPPSVNCQNICGNHRIDSAEECDGGDGCLASCKCAGPAWEAKSPPHVDCRPTCGNGQRDLGEDCDDTGGAHCSSCRCLPGFEPASPASISCQPICGNGHPDTGEECEPTGTGCTSGCVCATGYYPKNPRANDCEPHCGDGIPVPPETCDDGFRDACGACNATCSGPGTGSVCGDGFRCPETEVCDDGGTNDCGPCNATCTAPGTGSTCSDDVVCPDTEACDDGGTSDCGPCNATCSGPGTGSVCGDGVRCPETEFCDDGGTNNCGPCNATCTAPGLGSVCGDGIVCPDTEVCDDHFTDECGSCNATCTGPGTGSVCGDGGRCPETEDCETGADCTDQSRPNCNPSCKCVP